MEYWILKQRQMLSLDGKIRLTRQRIIEWYEHYDGDVYVSFSGGKDSTAMLYQIWSIYPSVPAVFMDTGLEFPEIRSFVFSLANTIVHQYSVKKGEDLKTIAKHFGVDTSAIFNYYLNDKVRKKKGKLRAKQIVYIPKVLDHAEDKGTIFILKPTMTFKEVIDQYGYPVISKTQAMAIRKLTTQNLSDEYRNKLLHGDAKGKAGKLSDKWHYLLKAPFKISEMCCEILKKRPVKIFEKHTHLHPYIGLMACESQKRKENYLNGGCNAFNLKKPKSRPIGFWLDKDIWQYLKQNRLRYCTVYDMGYNRTGCVYCMFGVHMESYPNRFQRMYYTHRNLYNYCIYELGLCYVLDYIGVDYKPRETIENVS